MVSIIDRMPCALRSPRGEVDSGCRSALVAFPQHSLIVGRLRHYFFPSKCTLFAISPGVSVKGYDFPPPHGEYPCRDRHSHSTPRGVRGYNLIAVPCGISEIPQISFQHRRRCHSPPARSARRAPHGDPGQLQFPPGGWSFRWDSRSCLVRRHDRHQSSRRLRPAAFFSELSFNQ